MKKHKKLKKLIKILEARISALETILKPVPIKNHSLGGYIGENRFGVHESSSRIK